MKKNIFKLLLVVLFLGVSLNAKDTSNILHNTNKTYFLPDETKEVQDKIIDLIDNSKKSIKIAMYNFSYKKFAKKLAKASKNGIKITVILDKSKVKKDDEMYNYLKKNGIEVIVPKVKMHTKLALFDSKNLVLGSSNWTKESFKKNYEIIFFTKDKKVIKKVEKFLVDIQKKH